MRTTAANLLFLLPFITAVIAAPAFQTNDESLTTTTFPSPDLTIPLLNPQQLDNDCTCTDPILEKRTPDARKYPGERVNGSKAHDGFGEKRNGAGKNVRPGNNNKKKELSSESSSSSLEKRSASPASLAPPRPPRENSNSFVPAPRTKTAGKLCPGCRQPLPKGKAHAKRALEDITNIPRPVPRPGRPGTVQPRGVEDAYGLEKRMGPLGDITNRPKPGNPNPPPVYGEVHKREAGPEPEAQCPGGCCGKKGKGKGKGVQKREAQPEAQCPGGCCGKKGKGRGKTLQKREAEAEPQCPGGCCGNKKGKGKGKNFQKRDAEPEAEAQCPGGCCGKKGKGRGKTLQKREAEAEAQCPGGCCGNKKGKGKILQKRSPVLEDITNIPRPIRPVGGAPRPNHQKRFDDPLGDVTNVPRPERPHPRPHYPGGEN